MQELLKYKSFYRPWSVIKAMARQIEKKYRHTGGQHYLMTAPAAGKTM
jgi:hypothetical protein